MDTEKKNKFSFHYFFCKATSRKLLVWLIASFFVREIIHKNDDRSYFIPLVIVWGVVTVVYLIGKPLEDAISYAIKKAEIRVQMNNNIDTQIRNK